MVSKGEKKGENSVQLIHSTISARGLCKVFVRSDVHTEYGVLEHPLFTLVRGRGVAQR